MSGAFAYLILTSARNRIRTRLARLRNPRYAFAMVIGVAYLWFVYLRPTRHDAARMDMLAGPVIGLLPLLLLAYAAWIWIFGSDRNALAFSPAEVTLLFTAPVTRRDLVLYKIARTQIPIVTTSLVWTLILRRSPTLPSALTHVVAYWVLLSTMNLNRLGVAIIRASGEEGGVRGARKHWLSIALAAAILLMVAVPLAAAAPAIRAAADLSARTDLVLAAIQSSSAHWALLPFRVLLAPLAAAPGWAFAAALAPALALLGAMLLWVLATNSAFEEAAIAASARLAQRVELMRSRRAGVATAVPKRTRAIPLAPTGAPAVALLWKNAMWALRTGQLRSLLMPPGAALLLVAILAPRSEIAAVLIALGCGFLALAMLIVGPLTMRNDLRSELLHLSLLKTFPLRGRDVVLAEVASSALPLALLQYLLGLVALASLAFAKDATLPPGVRLALVLGAPVLLVGLNCVASLIHNGLALLFPGWVRLGPGSAGGGIETLGLGMISMAAALIVLVLMLLVPGLVAAIIVALLRQQLAIAVLLGGLAGGALLLGEVTLGSWALGGSLDRVEPMSVEG